MERSMINEDWQNNPYGSQDIHGFRGDYITRGKRGGGGKKSYKGWSKGPLFNFLKSKFDSAN